MLPIRQILCAIDFSEPSQRALDYAVTIGRACHSRVVALHVCPVEEMPVRAYGGPVVAEPISLTGADRQRVTAELKALIAGVKDGTVWVDAAMAEGRVPEQILTRAQILPADLLVVGTHGRSGFERLMLGSIAEKLLRKAPCPVLTVPPNAPDAIPTRPTLFRRIVCGVDFSDSSVTALNYAIAFARETGARLMVLHVHEKLLEQALPPFEREYYDVTEYVNEYAQAALVRLSEAVPASAREAVDFQPIVAIGKPHREILRLARDSTADLIVLGVHGRGDAERLFFGSTAQHVVREATCPVLTVRVP